MILNILSLLLLAALALGENVRVNPLPAPQSISWGDSGAIAVDIGNIRISGTPNSIFKSAAERTLATIAKLQWVPQSVEHNVPVNKPGPSTVTDIKVFIRNTDQDLQFGVDETYELKLPSGSNTIYIGSETVWGALHALSTLQQIVISDGSGGFLIEQPVKIQDRPLYSHRGFLVDTARNYIPIDALKRQIDAMALSKLNVLHWHFEDAPAWPLEVPGVDKMVQGAYSPSKVFHANDVKEFVEYARARGVRVIPEIELPAHVGEGWLQAMPDCVLCSADCCGQIDVLSDACYEGITNVYKGTSSLFRDNVFHIGGDEIATSCWEASDKIKEWMKEDSRDWHDVTQYYIDRSLPIFHNSTHRKLIVWEDIVIGDVRANSVPRKDILVQAWHHSAVKNLTEMGYDVIASPSEFVYLDCGFGGILSNDHEVDVQDDPTPGTPSYNYGGSGGSWCAPYKDWQRVYAYDVTYDLNSDEAKRVKGLEATLWGELNDETTIDSKLWPRAASLAEVAWSGNKGSDGKSRLYEFGSRLYNFREMLKVSGVGASPITAEFCWKNPHFCDASPAN